MIESERRIVLRLNLSDLEQKRAWEIISSIPKGKRNKYLYQLLLKKKEQDGMRELVYQAVRHALAEHGGLSVLQENKNDEQAGEISSDILGFLSALQKEGDR